MIPFFCYENQARILELRLLSQQSDDFWAQRDARRLCVSASEVPIICGFGGRDRTPAHLWNQKKYNVNPPLSDYVQSMLDEGKRREPVARNWFSSEYNCPVMETGLWVHPVDQRIAASPDALAWMPELGGQVPLELKCPYDKRTKITSARVHKDSLQLQTQIQCTGAQCGFLVYFYAVDDPDNLVFFVQQDWSLWLEIVAHCHWFIDSIRQCENNPHLLEIDYNDHIKRYSDEFIAFTQKQYTPVSYQRTGDQSSAAQLQLSISSTAGKEATRRSAKRRGEVSEAQAKRAAAGAAEAARTDN